MLTGIFAYDFVKDTGLLLLGNTWLEFVAVTVAAHAGAPDVAV